MAHYVRKRMRAGDLHYTYIATNENIADCMTKNSYYPALLKKFRAARRARHGWRASMDP